MDRAREGELYRLIESFHLSIPEFSEKYNQADLKEIMPILVKIAGWIQSADEFFTVCTYFSYWIDIVPEFEQALFEKTYDVLFSLSKEQWSSLRDALPPNSGVRRLAEINLRRF